MALESVSLVSIFCARDRNNYTTIEWYGGIQSVPGYSEDALWPWNTRQSRGVHGLSYSDASARPKSEWCVKFIGFIGRSDVLFSELNLFVGQLTPKQKADPAVRHALGVQRALAMGNYHSLFDLYLTSPNMGAYIMDHFIDRERVKALMIITKAYVSCCNGVCFHLTVLL